MCIRDRLTTHALTWKEHSLSKNNILYKPLLPYCATVLECIDYNECHCRRRRSGEKNVVNFCKEAPASSTALLLFLFSVPLLYFILSIELSSMLELSRIIILIDASGSQSMLYYCLK